MTTDFTESVNWLYMGQWPCYVGFVFAQEPFDAEWRRMKLPGEPHPIQRTGSACTHLFDHPKHGIVIIVGIPREYAKKPKAAAAALLAHECVHVVQYIKEEYSPTRDLGVESEAYLYQYLVQCGLELLWNPKKKVSSEEPNPLN